MRTCFLHIGPHKTGSSTIQGFLLDNTGRLMASGVYVPAMGALKQASKHEAFATEINLGKEEACRALLAEELNRAGLPDRIIISSESLSNRIHLSENRDRIDRFFARLGYRVVILAYVRPQVDRINSLFTQVVKRLRRDVSFDEFFAEFISAPDQDFNVKFAGLIGDTRFRTILVPYNSGLLRKGIHRDLAERLGILPEDIEGLPAPRDRNQSPGPRTIAALMQIRRTLSEREIHVTKDILSGTASSLRKMASQLQWNSTRYFGPTEEQRRRIIDHFGPANVEFALKVWGERWENHFADDEARILRQERCVFDPALAGPAEREEFDEFCAFGLGLLTAPRDRRSTRHG